MKKKEKILITGASGFIGSHLVEYILADHQPSESLRLLIPPWESLKNLPNRLFEIAIADVRDGAEVDNAVKGVDIIYHLAAKTIIPNGSYSYYKDTNVNGTENLIKAAKKYEVKKFIFFSSISVFGLPAWVGDMKNVDETWPKSPAEGYGRTKFEAEKEIIKASKKYKIPYLIIRPTTVYGPRDKAGIFQLFRAIDKNVFFNIGDGNNLSDYVYVVDLVRAARLAEKSKLTNEDFIIGSGKPIRQKALIKTVCRSIGKKPSKLHLPKNTALALSFIVERVSKTFGYRPLFFPERVKVLTTNCYFDTSKAQKLLGYQPDFSFEKGIRETTKWMRRQKIIK